MTGGSKGFARITKSIVLGGLLLALAASLLLWYAKTRAFERWVRLRLVAAIENATGGRAELGRFHLIPLRFAIAIDDLTIHGREPAGDVPLVHVDRVHARVNLPAIFGSNIGFRSLTLEHPVVHLILYP